MVAGCRSLPPTPPEGKGELWAAIFFIATSMRNYFWFYILIRDFVLNDNLN